MYYNNLFLFCLAYLYFLVYNVVGDYMKLVEKKCPNCGASLEFNETDKSCKCEYCKRVFEIERDNSINSSSISDQFQLNKLEKPLKIFGIYMASTYIIGGIVVILVFIFIGICGYKIYNSANKNFNDAVNKTVNKTKNSDKYLSSIDEINNSNYEDIDNDAKMKIISVGKGVNDSRHSYNRDNNPIREKIYVASKNNGNKVIAIYKTDYYDFFHQENRFSIYVPIVYENIKNSFLGYEFENPNVSAPEYYFDAEKSAYAYGYGSFEEAYTSLVKPLEKDYKITQK